MYIMGRINHRKGMRSTTERMGAPFIRIRIKGYPSYIHLCKGGPLQLEPVI